MNQPSQNLNSEQMQRITELQKKLPPGVATHPRFQREMRRLIQQRENKLALLNLLENYHKQNVYHKYAAARKSALDSYESECERIKQRALQNIAELVESLEEQKREILLYQATFPEEDGFSDESESDNQDSESEEENSKVVINESDFKDLKSEKEDSDQQNDKNSPDLSKMQIDSEKTDSESLTPSNKMDIEDNSPSNQT